MMARKGARSKELKKKALEDPKDEYLSRFVLEDGEKTLGESVGIEKDMIVIKEGDAFFMIPLKSVELSEDRLHLKESVDWRKAKRKGEKWRKNELDPL